MARLVVDLDRPQAAFKHRHPQNALFHRLGRQISIGKWVATLTVQLVDAGNACLQLRQGQRLTFHGLEQREQLFCINDGIAIKHKTLDFNRQTPIGLNGRLHRRLRQIDFNRLR